MSGRRLTIAGVVLASCCRYYRSVAFDSRVRGRCPRTLDRLGESCGGACARRRPTQSAPVIYAGDLPTVCLIDLNTGSRVQTVTGDCV